MGTIATVTGRLTLTVGDASIDLGQVSIPITATVKDNGVGLVLTSTPDMREVRDLITQVFAAEGRKAQG